MTSITEARQQQLSPGLALKTPCRAASTGALVLSGEQTVDGIALITGDRCLVKNQANSIDNGVYYVSTGAWTRAQDWDGTGDVVDGTIVMVRLGTNPFALYRAVSAASPVIPGTSAVTFALAGTAGDANNLTFTQIGAHAQQRTGTSKMRDVVSLLDFAGVTGDNVADDTVGISGAITDVQASTNRPALYAPGRTYLVTDQLTAIPGQFTLYGDGRQQTIFHFKPTAARSCFKWANGAAQVINVFMRDFAIYSDDAAQTKKGIEINDATTCGIENVYIYGNGAGVVGAPAPNLYFSGGAGSKGIEINGRDSCYIRGAEIIADYPIYIGANPNAIANLGEDCDHWHFSDLYLLGNGHYNVTVADGHGLEEVTFDGFQAWVGGTGGFYMNDTRAAPTVASRGITFKNVRGEQCTDANGYWFNINAAFRVGSIGFENVFGDVSAQGIKIDRVLKLDLERVTMATAAAKDSLKVTTPDSDSVIFMRNCEWQLGSVFTLTNYTACMIAAFNATDFQGPNTAVYVANTDQAGTAWNGGSVTAHVVPTLSAFVGSGTGGGDRFKLAPGAAGNGMNQIVRNDADTLYGPQLLSNSYTGMLNKIYPGTDAAAFQTVAGIYAGNGAPNNANGANGDFYFRGDGTQAGNTVIYHKQAGAWVALITT